MLWNDSEKQALAKKWHAGESAEAIGASMGYSRGKIAGMVRRMKLPARSLTKEARVEATAKVQELWLAGVPLNEIAKTLGITRDRARRRLISLNLIAKGHGRTSRKGFGTSGLTSKVNSARKVLRLFNLGSAGFDFLFVPIPKTDPFIPTPEIEIPLEQRRSLQSLKAGECHWPVGDPVSTEFFFCGGATSRTYCEHHHGVAYKPECVA